jgi:signal transduction histidine kinase
MKKEIEVGNIPAIKTITDDLETNMEKITHHGKRADAIVKSMLQHSRTSAGQKEPTDINSLADEYLRLSYHGLRAKDKSFNASIKTDFDENIGKINIVAQDMGRVLLNLFNNAFYSVSEKKRQKGAEFDPIVSVTSKMMGDKVEIRVRDNGLGVSQIVQDKIYQPFFTTKPAGHGTGLGLSLSYDIVTKEHSGQIKLETREGEFAEFIIELPVK